MDRWDANVTTNFKLLIRHHINGNFSVVKTDSTEIQRIIRDFYKQIYADKMNNLEEMGKFLERYNLPRLNQEGKGDIDRPITSNEIETVIKNLPSPGSDGFTAKFYQTFRAELTPILLKSYEKLQTKEYF